jgi:hypothetical protein
VTALAVGTEPAEASKPQDEEPERPPCRAIQRSALLESLSFRESFCRKMSSSENLRRRRLGDLKRVLRHRYGHELPDDDAGRADLELLLDVVSFARDAKRRMKNVIETWAPWMDTAESYELVENVLQKPEYLRKVKAADLGARLNLTWEERHELSIRTIAPADLTPEQFEDRRRERRRAKQRVQKERSRRKAGVKSRIVRRATSLTHLKPWAALRMSRATWYRRRRSETAGETDVSSHKLLDSRETDVSQSVVVES